MAIWIVSYALSLEDYCSIVATFSACLEPSCLTGIPGLVPALGVAVIELLERAEARLPDHRLVSREIAFNYLRQASRALPGKQVNIAEKSLRRTLAADPSSAEASFALAHMRMKAGDPSGAAGILQAAHRQGISSRRAHLVLGQIHLDAGRTGEAGVEFERAIAKDPQNAETRKRIV